MEKQDNQYDFESSSQIQDYCSREEIWEDYPLCDLHIAWEYRANGEKVDYYAYISTGEDGSISPDQTVIKWETSWKN